jgi:signal peptidase II
VVKKFPNINFLITSLSIFFIDFSTKYFLLNFYDLENKGKVFITPFMDFVLVYNPGISYGLLGGGGEIQRVVLIVLSLLIIAYLIYWIRESNSNFISFGICLIIGGALGNMIDRILYGKVIDFISLHVFDYYWYVFNIADIAIVSGGISVLIYSAKDSFSNS